MNTSLKHLSFFHQQQLEIARRVIIQSIQPEKIILFGVFSVPEEAALYTERLPPGLISYDLLVITREGDRRTDFELQDIIENRCRGLVPVTAVVHDIAYVNRQIEEGHYFFNSVCLEGISLYHAARAFLAKPVRPDWKKIKERGEEDYERWRDQARAFYKSAIFNQGEKEWKLAAFLLHQTAEHLYQAILLAFMGYKPTTHNLDKLRRYTNRLSLDLALLFPRDTDAEDYLFKLLTAGYVDARYKQFIIKEEELTELVSRVGKMLEIADRICRNRFLSLEKRSLVEAAAEKQD